MSFLSVVLGMGMHMMGLEQAAGFVVIVRRAWFAEERAVCTNAPLDRGLPSNMSWVSSAHRHQRNSGEIDHARRRGGMSIAITASRGSRCRDWVRFRSGSANRRRMTAGRQLSIRSCPSHGAVVKSPECNRQRL